MGRIALWWIVGVLVTVALVVGIFFLSLYLKRPAYDITRQAVKRSLQYTESKVSQLLQLEEEWRRLEIGIAATDDQKLINTKRSQQYYLEQRMRVEASRIDEKAIPLSVQEIMRRKR